MRVMTRKCVNLLQQVFLNFDFCFDHVTGQSKLVVFCKSAAAFVLSVSLSIVGFLVGSGGRRGSGGFVSFGGENNVGVDFSDLASLVDHIGSVEDLVSKSDCKKNQHVTNGGVFGTGDGHDPLKCSHNICSWDTSSWGLLLQAHSRVGGIDTGLKGCRSHDLIERGTNIVAKGHDMVENGPGVIEIIQGNQETAKEKGGDCRRKEDAASECSNSGVLINESFPFHLHQKLIICSIPKMASSNITAKSSAADSNTNMSAAKRKK